MNTLAAIWYGGGMLFFLVVVFVQIVPYFFKWFKDLGVQKIKV